MMKHASEKSFKESSIIHLKGILIKIQAGKMQHTQTG